jgi:hypothetical protein
MRGSTAALKEWAIVCEALADGRQTALIRKGGILEVKDGFQVEHRDFWLFPTQVHQNLSDLAPSVHERFLALQAAPPVTEWLELRLFGRVVDEVTVTDLEQLRGLEGEHILSWECVASRFHYRGRPGVHVLVLRVYRRPHAARIPVRAWYDGCVSWVELDEVIDTGGLQPVLSDAEFAARRATLRDRLGLGRPLPRA